MPKKSRHSSTTGLVCVNDRYCPQADVFTSLADFQAMCEYAFGERAILTRRGNDYIDEHGEVVLRPVEDYARGAKANPRSQGLFTIGSRLRALPSHEGSAQRRSYGRGMDALARARRVVAAGGVPINLNRRLPGGLTIGEVLANEARGASDREPNPFYQRSGFYPASASRKVAARYDVVVDNVGTVYSGASGVEARKEYAAYVKQSRTGMGRAGGESVTLYKNGGTVKEHYGDTGTEYHADREPNPRRTLPEITSLASRFCRAPDGGPEAGAALRELRGAVASATQPRRQVEAAIRRGVSRRFAEAGAVVDAAYR